MGHKKIIVTFIIFLLINGIELQNEYPYQEQLPPNMYSNVLPENNPIYMDYQSQPVYQDLQQSAMYPEVQQPAIYPDMQQPDLQQPAMYPDLQQPAMYPDLQQPDMIPQMQQSVIYPGGQMGMPMNDWNSYSKFIYVRILKLFYAICNNSPYLLKQKKNALKKVTHRLIQFVKSFMSTRLFEACSIPSLVKVELN